MLNRKAKFAIPGCQRTTLSRLPKSDQHREENRRRKENQVRFYNKKSLKTGSHSILVIRSTYITRSRKNENHGHSWGRISKKPNQEHTQFIWTAKNIDSLIVLAIFTRTSFSPRRSFRSLFCFFLSLFIYSTFNFVLHLFKILSFRQRSLYGGISLFLTLFHFFLVNNKS